MNYWNERWESALKYENRFNVAMFLYDSTFEKGAHPSKVLSEVIEKFSLNNPECVIRSLDVLSKGHVEAVIKHYYIEPLLNKPESFSNLVTQLRANKAN